MRISHNDLEGCLRNPSMWARNRLTRSALDFIRRGYDGSTKLAIFAFHKHNEDYARSKLSVYLSDFSSLDRIKEAEDNLSSYIDWYHDENPIVVDTRVRLAVDIGFENTLAGEVSRVDIRRDKGYRGIIIGSIPANWVKQLRMPLIQFGLAQHYARDPDEIEVGWQALSGRPLQTKCYTDREINRAFKEVTRISGLLYEEAVAHTSTD